MDRRDFLKFLGLAGVALSTPKPLEVIAAKMATISAPPLHVGYCELGPLADDSRTFVMNNLGVGIQRALQLYRYSDYCEYWMVKAVRKIKVGNETVRTTVLAIPSSHMPDPISKFRSIYVPNENDDGYTPAAVPDHYPMAHPYMFSPGESMELWFAPADHHRLPKYCLPELTVMLGGHMVYKKEKPSTGREYVLGGRVMSFMFTEKVQTLQIERAKAIEIGLIDGSEPEGLIL